MTNNTEIQASTTRRMIRRTLKGSAVVLTVLALSAPATSFASTSSTGSATSGGVDEVIPSATVSLNPDDTLDNYLILNNQAAYVMHAWKLVYTH